MTTTSSRYQQVMADPRTPTCLTPDCGRKAWARGLCSMCLNMIRTYGVARTGWHDPAEILRRRTAFFWANVDRRGPDECWPWLRKPNGMGYGQLRWVGTSLQAHRVAYLLQHGELPEDMEIDHICHRPQECKRKRECPHRLCCNPAHLEAVPRPVNLKRSNRARPGNGGSKECAPGCTCDRHRSQACPPGCNCGRHASTACKPGCDCGRHRRASPQP